MGLFRFFKRKPQIDTTETSSAQGNHTIEDGIVVDDATDATMEIDAPQPTAVIEPEPEKTAVSAEVDQITSHSVATTQQDTADETIIEAHSPSKISLFSRLKTSLKKTRSQLGTGLGTLLLGQKNIDEDLLEELETLLLTADVGLDTTQLILDKLQQDISRKQPTDSTALLNALRRVLTDLLTPCEQPLDIHKPDNGPYVLLMIGVNGAGKTTTIGKLAKYMQDAGLKVMLAAGDTFRAAAVEQLKAWGERNQIPVVAQATGSDSASVIFDALQSAKAKQIDVLIADTAGRLHNKQNLMAELQKVIRVIQKLDPQAPHETLLALDASMGQNALKQAAAFHESTQVSGLALTKLDGTAKGGTVFSIAHQLQLPIRFIGLGEGIEDLREFQAQAFVDALLDTDT